jgi:hypothetical protein
MPTTAKSLPPTNLFLRVRQGVTQAEYKGRIYRAGGVIKPEDDREFLLAARLLSNSTLVVTERGEVVNRTTAIKAAEERLKKVVDGTVTPRDIRQQQRTQRKVAKVDPKTDEGERGPGLSKSEMIALSPKDLVLPPPNRMNKAKLQAFFNKFKMGRPPMSATVNQIHQFVAQYIEEIRRVRGEDVEADKARKEEEQKRVDEVDTPKIYRS